MKTIPTACLFFALLAPAGFSEEGFESIFDGKTLNNWDGNPKFWSVKDGAITGQTTKENPTSGNTFIIYKGKDLENFELKAKYKITAGNSGIQYRSFKKGGNNDGWRIGGYQADLDAGLGYAGANYGEGFRGMLAVRGAKVEIDENGKKKKVADVGDGNELKSKIKKNDWNEYHIIAKGNHLVQKINGHVMSELIDKDKNARASGLLALQLHAGPPMLVQFKDIQLKRLSK